MKKTSNINGIVVEFPGIEAKFDAFGVADCIERFENSQRPTFHEAFQLMYQMLRKKTHNGIFI